ncbi:hypothetical protein HOY80DRAFT_1138181 [Tuber brumale]|nr:hypothetical protein HOY80DRAFT_1138181 [Tuber brumale]
MSNSPTAKHSPKYKDFLFGGTITLYVGRLSNKMEMHKKLLASISPELDKHVNNDMREGIEGVIHLPDENEEVFTLFTKWAYTGDYDSEELIPLDGVLKKDPWLSLHQHLQLFVFSDKFNIPALRQLAESKFRTEIIPLKPNGRGDAASLVTLIGYAYDNLPSSDPFLKLLARYASWRFKLLRATDGFTQLIVTQPSFLKELFMNLEGLNTNPMVTATPSRFTYQEHRGPPAWGL